MDTNAIRASFDIHRAHPEVSIEKHVLSQRIKLGESVMARERVYLDKCYWIILRDVVLGRVSDPSSVALLSSLRDRVQSKRSICPISETVFIELLKQADLETRRATAKLIDELCEGVTLLPHPDRVSIEISHFLHSLGAGNSNFLPLETLVWSKLSYVLGIQHPVSQLFPEDEQRVIQKAFFDHMWQFSLTEMVDIIGSEVPPHFDFEAVANRMNESSALNANNIISFAQAYKAEIRGSLSLFMHVAREVLESMGTRQSDVTAEASREEHMVEERQLLDYFCKNIRNDEVSVALRTLHIGALCHAAVRWDKQRKLTGNDLYDFHHAEAAVGYCDVFLTERPLKTLIQQRHMKLQSNFPCRVISAQVEAAEWAST